MTTRKLFHDSVIELPPQPGAAPAGLHVHAAGPDHRDDPMTVSFSLSPDGGLNEELEARVARGETVPIDEIRDKYGVRDDRIEPLVKWLEANGFRNVSVSADRTSIYAQSTASAVAKALQVEMVRVNSGGITYTSARNAPSLPDDVAMNVRAIGGLQPHRQAHRHLRSFNPAFRGATSAGASDAAAAVRGYGTRQILGAYGADGLQVNGSGQTIAIVIDAAPSTADMTKFWKLNGVVRAAVEVANVTSKPLPPPTGEETLDAQWTSGIATGAKVRIYATSTLQFVDIDRALDQILADAGSEPGLRQVSMSLGLGEAYMAPAEVKTEHAKFVRLAAAGINVFVSSGDAGSNPDDTGHGAGGPLQAEYESSDPCVVGVGGTTLKLEANGKMDETAWSGSGGGKSRLFARPAWQKGPGVQPGASRMVPDVSLIADPNHGAMVVLNGIPVEYGGTSLSAPVWAAFCALLNESRIKQGKPALPFLNPLFYPLHGTPCFRDIRGGSNGAYESRAGYDMVTGLGVPNVSELVKAL